MGKTMRRRSSIMSITVVALATSALLAPVQAHSLSPEVLTKAGNNCLTSVAEVVGRPRDSLKVIQHTSDASGISVDVKVPKAAGPWACLTDQEGKVKETYFKGSEGAR